MNGALHAEMVDHGRHVIGIVIHVVTVPNLTRASVTAAVVRDDAIALRQEKEHLGVPVIGTERPTVMEEDDLCVARPPVLVEDLNAILRCDISHDQHSFSIFRLTNRDVYGDRCCSVIGGSLGEGDGRGGNATIEQASRHIAGDAQVRVTIRSDLGETLRSYC